MSSSLGQFFQGKPEQYTQQPTFSPQQQPLFNNLQQAGQGSFTDVGDYFRNLMSNDPAQLQAMAQPDIRQFNQQTIPGLANQFAGNGAGGSIYGSGFRNAALQAGTDLQERIASLRAGLRQQGAQGLQGLGQQGLGQYFANTYQPRSPGLLEQLGPLLASAGIGFATGGPAGAGVGALGGLLNWLKQNSPQGSGSHQDFIQPQQNNNLPGYDPTGFTPSYQPQYGGG